MPSENCADPREGVRFAYLILNPSHDDQDYEDWEAEQESTNGELGPHELFAGLCENAISSDTEIERYQEKSICFAGGYHTAMAHIAVALEYVTNQREQSRHSSISAENQERDAHTSSEE